MTKEELEQWWVLREQIVNGWHMSDGDYKELIRLNRLVLEASGKIHNDNIVIWQKVVSSRRNYDKTSGKRG